MFGRFFRCAVCEHTYKGGLTRIFTTTALPKGRFYGIGDPKGLWLIYDAQSYCPECTKECFPETRRENIVFAQESMSLS